MGVVAYFILQGNPTTYDSEIGFRHHAFLFLLTIFEVRRIIYFIMKKLLYLFVILLSQNSFASSSNKPIISLDSTKTSSVSLINSDTTKKSESPSLLPCHKNDPIKISGETITRTKDRYKIYPTPNMYNFLKLDTRTGVIYRIQWSLTDNKRYESYVSRKLLVDLNDDWIDGRFEIYPTTNIYSFLLLDKINGRVWHCQWGFSASHNWIERIY